MYAAQDDPVVLSIIEKDMRVRVPLYGETGIRNWIHTWIVHPPSEGGRTDWVRYPSGSRGNCYVSNNRPNPTQVVGMIVDGILSSLTSALCEPYRLLHN